MRALWSRADAPYAGYLDRKVGRGFFLYPAK
jgi:hypothetical protein